MDKKIEWHEIDLKKIMESPTMDCDNECDDCIHEYKNNHESFTRCALNDCINDCTKCNCDGCDGRDYIK